jgi:cytochrome c oxidase assembly protein subunit 15
VNSSRCNPWLFRFAVLTALATLGLVGMGGLVTSHGVGMAVPDWPTSYGYNMFALPLSTWLTGGVFHEHTHRLWASFVGVLVVALTRWLGGRESRMPLLVIGAAELLAGAGLLRLGADWRGAGHFLQGIGGVVLLAGLVWARNECAGGRLPQLGWAAFWLVQLQGLLGGLRVVLNAHVLADVRLGTAFGIFHGCLAQVFLVLLVVIALFTSRWWLERQVSAPRAGLASGAPARLIFVAAILIFAQLLIGATMRHQHAGLAIVDFPLAHGSLWPDMSVEAVARYNAQRIEINSANPITAAQIALQMTHRLMALGILVAVAVVAWRGRNAGGFRRLGFLWLGLILVQAALGAWTIWSNKAADVATAHVVVGALSLVTGAVASIITLRRFYPSGATIPAGATIETMRTGGFSSPPASP